MVELILHILQSYLWNGGRVGDGRHDFVDEIHGDVTHHPWSFVFFVVKGFRGFAFFSHYD